MSRVAIAAPGRAAVEAGLAIADDGGNAVDAAIATVLVASCTEPAIVSPMGGAFITVWAPGQAPVVLDGNVEMPGRGQPRERFGTGADLVFMDYGGGTTVYGGPGSVATPGMFAAISQASDRWGRTPWRELLAPAARVLREGYPLGATSAFYLYYARQRLFAQDPDTVAFLSQCGPANRPPTTGTTMTDPALAQTLDHLGRHGAADLYTGELAHAFADDMAARGGLITDQDLVAYAVVARPALRSRLVGWDVATNPPPSIGGPTLTAMLRLLERRARQGEVRRRDVIDVQRLVLGYRHHRMDEADDLAASGHELIALLDDLGEAGLAAITGSPETIHVSTCDDTGLACSITTSAGYGSGVTIPGTGLALNNALGEIELNRRGLHALVPGTRLASNMAPTVARHDDGSVLSIGSPGADRITTALMQVLSAFCLEGRPLQEADDAPRLHVTYADGTPTVLYEDVPELHAVVASCGLPSRPYPPATMYFGGVGATISYADGTLAAAADPRRAAATGTSRG